MATLILIFFIIGYLAIAFEHSLKINKAAPALITGVICWTIYILSSTDKDAVHHQLNEGVGEYAGILFFLLGAMTIVEIIDAHNGFDIITQKIRTSSRRKLLWIISLVTFFLSPVLDNLTTAIVMASLVQKIVKEPEERFYYMGMIVIAANAGGAWSPIGDVTTTMLWLGGQITAANIIIKLFLPSVVCLIVPLLVLSIKMKGNFSREEQEETSTGLVSRRRQLIILCSGIFFLIAVPVFKTLTHLPPFMGILIGLGMMWIITELLGNNQEETERFKLSPAYALRKIDSPSILFFLGILLSIGALQATGILSSMATGLSNTLQNENLIVLAIGLLSAIVDNVPLVAATQGMYSLQQYPTDHYFWEFLAYSTGTGGSALIIGSAAGVAIMGVAKINFMWYLKRISLLAILGYLAGALVYILLHS